MNSEFEERTAKEDNIFAAKFALVVFPIILVAMAVQEILPRTPLEDARRLIHSSYLGPDPQFSDLRFPEEDIVCGYYTAPFLEGPGADRFLYVRDVDGSARVYIDNPEDPDARAAGKLRPQFAALSKRYGC